MFAELGARWLSELEQNLFKKSYRGKTLQECGQDDPGSPMASWRLLFGLALPVLLFVSSLGCIIPGSPWSEAHHVKFACGLFLCQNSFPNSSLDQILKV